MKRLMSFILSGVLLFSSFGVHKVYADDVNWAIEPKFVAVGGFSEGLAFASEDGKTYGYIDKSGDWVIKPKLPFSKGNDDLKKFQFKNGLAPAYETITDRKWGFIDKTGNFSIQPQYDIASIFNEGLALVHRGRNVDELKNGIGLYEKIFIDTTGKIVLHEPEKMVFDYGYFSDGFAKVGTYIGDESYFSFIDNKGKVVLSNIIPHNGGYGCTNFREGIAHGTSKTRKGIAFFDKTGKVLFEKPWADGDSEYYYSDFSDGLCVAYDNGSSMKSIIIDKSGKEIKTIDGISANGFSEGISIFFRRDGKEGTYGFLDRNGNIISMVDVDSIGYGNGYDQKFSEGMVQAKVNDKWGFIANPLKNTSVSTTASQNKTKVVYKGKEIALALPIISKNNTTFYPFRECLESMGATVSWDSDKNMATGTLNGKTVSFITNSEKYYINGQEQKLGEGMSAFINNGRTYIPIRSAAEGLGFKIAWDAVTATITIE